jgi:4-hydroxybenzoate polyprenyltransferase
LLFLFVFYSLMASPAYTEGDIQNALADLKEGVALATAATRNGVPRNTLRGRLYGAQPSRYAHSDEQRLTAIQEEHLELWVLRQEALGYAPTHAQMRAIATGVLLQAGDNKPLGKRWSQHFIQRHPAIKSKLGRRTDWERINAATPSNITRLFDLYNTVSWIPPCRRYNADEGGIMEGQGINGLVIGSSQTNCNMVPVKTINARTWTSIVECISALGVVLHPLVIFKAKSIQHQWFRNEFLTKHPDWYVTFSENGWTSNDIAIEWLEKVFLPQTATDDLVDCRLLIVDGHGSHTSDAFMTMCYLNNVYLLFLPAHTSHVLQPLDLGCFSSLKTAYRKLINEHITLTDTTKVGKANFLEFYAKAREIGLREENVRSGWKATGLYPKNVAKPLKSRWVVVQKQPIISLPNTSIILSPKRGSDITKLFTTKNTSPASRLSIRKAAAALDKVAMRLVMRDREIEHLRARLLQANPPKRRKVQQNPNDRFSSLADILAQANQQPHQRVRLAKKAVSEVVIADSEEEGSETDEEVLSRRSGRERQPTKRYIERDEGEDEEDE